MDEKRLLVVMGLWLLLLAAYPLFFPTVTPPSPALPSPAATSVPTAQQPISPVPAPSTGTEPATVATLADQSERRVELSGRDIELAFTNRGGRLLSWRLKGFKDSRGRPEEMVPPTLESTPLRPLDIETGDKALDDQLRQALFIPSSLIAVAPEHGRAEIEFQFAAGNVTARKRIEIPGRGYAAQVEVDVRRQGERVPARILWGPGLGNPSPGEKELREYQPARGAYLDSDVERIASKDLESARQVSNPVWIGVESQFFAALFASTGPKLAGELRALPGPPDGDDIEWNTVAVIEASEAPVTLYVGPKEHGLLSEAGKQLDRAVDVNWLKPIVLPLLTALRWLNRHIGNYGWSLIALTVLINLAMAPLRHKSIANGLKMSKLAPEMRVIQDRYKKIPALDPRRQEMQREISELYGRHGMNMGTQMLVGCLPMLLTLPFLLAMYQLLHISIEMRGAPFLWIPDLSQIDPLYITPLLMGVSMFITNKMMPSTMDPAQQRVMMLMPIMFLGMFLWAPAGLNLYWLASNVCSIAQQGLTLSLLRREEAQGTKARKRS